MSDMEPPSDPEQAWVDYYERIRNRRLNEVKELWPEMMRGGVNRTTFFLFDFRHFSNEESSIRDLAAQLSENYEISIRSSDAQDDYWLLDGTTRPAGIDQLDESRLTDWVMFMCDVAQSYGCVFSTWQLTDQSRSLSWSSEDFEACTALRSSLCPPCPPW